MYKLTSNCKECTKKSSAKWNIENRERHIEIQKKYLQTEKGKKTINPENDKVRLRRWQINNPERVKNHRVKWVENNTHEISEEEWEECKRYFNHRCAYCDMKIEDHYIKVKGKFKLGDFHREHLIHDGLNDITNCVPSCKSCNSSKSDRLFEEWYKTQEYYSNDRVFKINEWITEKSHVYADSLN